MCSLMICILFHFILLACSYFTSELKIGRESGYTPEINEKSAFFSLMSRLESILYFLMVVKLEVDTAVNWEREKRRIKR